MDVILASQSPRRRELLQQAGVAFCIVESHASEELPEDAWSDPAAAAQMLAEKKAGAVAQTLLAEPGRIEEPTVVIGADTVVVLDGVVFGKPADEQDAKRMLRALAGRGHQVITGVSVWQIEPVGASGSGAQGVTSDPAGAHTTFAETSDVFFKPLSDEDIDAYLAEGESFDKAGAYAIQGKGARLVDRFEGDYDNIVGLPVAALLERFPQLAH